MDTDSVTLNEARQNALDALNDIVCFGAPRDAIRAAELLLFAQFPTIEPVTIMEAGDAAFVPCDCPVCDPDVDDREWDIPDDLPGDENLGLIFTYGVFRQ